MQIQKQPRLIEAMLDPEGDFVEALGRQHTPEAAARVIGDHIKDWKKPLRKD